MWGGKGGKAGTTVSCASQECLVWPGWEVFDWAVTHRGRRWPGPAQRCIQPPLHPSAGTCYTHSWHSTRVPSLLPPPAQFIPWHCNSHLWSYCTTLQTKAHADYCSSHGFLALNKRQGPSLVMSLQPSTSTSCSHVWSRWAGPVCTLISQRAAPIFQCYYSILKVQRGISELPVIPNIHSKVNNISCWVSSCNSFDMDIVNLRKRMASEVRGKGKTFSRVANSHHFLQAFDFVFPWKSYLLEFCWERRTQTFQPTKVVLKGRGLGKLVILKTKGKNTWINLNQTKALLVNLILVALCKINFFFLILWVYTKKAFVNHFTFMSYKHFWSCSGNSHSHISSAHTKC